MRVRSYWHALISGLWIKSNIYIYIYIYKKLYFSVYFSIIKKKYYMIDGVKKLIYFKSLNY